MRLGQTLSPKACKTVHPDGLDIRDRLDQNSRKDCDAMQRPLLDIDGGVGGRLGGPVQESRLLWRWANRIIL
jgi:hypothetical protein